MHGPTPRRAHYMYGITTQCNRNVPVDSTVARRRNRNGWSECANVLVCTVHGGRGTPDGGGSFRAAAGVASACLECLAGTEDAACVAQRIPKAPHTYSSTVHTISTVYRAATARHGTASLCLYVSACFPAVVLATSRHSIPHRTTLRPPQVDDLLLHHAHTRPHAHTPTRPHVHTSTRPHRLRRPSSPAPCWCRLCQAGPALHNCVFNSRRRSTTLWTNDHGLARRYPSESSLTSAPPPNPYTGTPVPLRHCRREEEHKSRPIQPSITTTSPVVLPALCGLTDSHGHCRPPSPARSRSVVPRPGPGFKSQ